MNKIKAWKRKCIFLLVLAGIFGVMGGVILGNAATNTETEAEKISTMHMVDGASVRYQDGYTTSKIGLRYSMRIEESEYEELLEEIGIGKTYSSVSFGFLVAPEEYITTFGELTVENVFGNNSIYCYDGAVEGKTEIINMNTGNLVTNGATLRDVTENGKVYKETNGSITNLKEENLAREYRGVGYAKFETLFGEPSYVLFDDGAENIRSMTYVAQRTIADPAVASEVKTLLEDAYVDPVRDMETEYVVNTYLVGEDGHSELHNQNSFSAYVGDGTDSIVEAIDTSSAIQGMEFHSMEVEDDTSVVYANGRTVINAYYAPANWSGYSILIKGTESTCTASDYEELVAEEVSAYLEKATGKTFPVVYTGEKGAFKTSNRYIVIGDNEFTNANKVGQRKLLIPTHDSVGDDGFQVTTIGKSVFIAGAADQGTVYGVYDYLNKVIGLDFFDANEAYVDNDVTFAVGEYNYTEKPDFNNRIGSGGLLASDEKLRLHLRTTTHQEVYSSSPYHNTFIYLNPSTYKSTHPNWYATTDVQLCYTAHGDATEYESMVNEVYTKMLAKLEADESLVNLAFTQEDTSLGQWCTCDTCSEYKTTYGSDAYGVVRFMNTLSDKLSEAGYGANGSAKRDITLSFFAYHDTEEAPAGITCNANVVPIIAPYYTYRNVALNTHGKNTWEKTNIDNWAKVADTLSFWWYSSNYYNAFYPYYTVDAMASDYKYLYELNNGANISIFNEGVGGIEGYASGFNKLYNYIAAKLMWDTSLDVDTLVDDYFEKYFGVAATSMRAYYDSYVSTIQAAVNSDSPSITYPNETGYEVPRGSGDTGTWYGYHERRNWISSTSYLTYYKSWFTETTLNSWSTSIDSALTAIADLETTDIQLYNTLKERIYTEKVLVDYWKLVLYGSSDVETFGQQAEQLQQDMLEGNVLLSKYKNSSTEPTRFILDSDARVVSYKLSKLSRFTADNITAMDGQEIAYARKIYDAQSENVDVSYLTYLTTAEALYSEKFAVVSDTTDLSSYSTTNSYGWQGKLSIEKDDTYGWYLNAYYKGGNNVAELEEQAVITFSNSLSPTLTGYDHVEFYVYNGASDNAKMILTFNGLSTVTSYGTLTAGEWTKVTLTIEQAQKLTGFGIYSAKYRNGGEPCTFKFSMMYGVK